MSRGALIALLLVIATHAWAEDVDLLQITAFGSKGRVQDSDYQPFDPQIELIINMGVDAVPRLIDRLESDRQFQSSPKPFWPEMTEGDAALIILTGLFLDSTGRQSTVHELCWDNVLQRKDPNSTASEVLHEFVVAQGRSEIAARWRRMWSRHWRNVVWDADDRYFKVVGRQLTLCDVRARLQLTQLDLEEVQSFLESMRLAVADDDAIALSTMVRYPMTAVVEDEKVEIADPTQFLSHYDQMISADVVTAISHTRIEDVWANVAQVSVGEGALSFGKVCDNDACEQYELKILGINDSIAKAFAKTIAD